MDATMLWPKVKSLWDNRLASADKHKVVCSPEIPTGKDPDLVVAGNSFWWFSGLTPTKQEIASGTIQADFMGDGVLVSDVTIPADGILFDSDVLYGGYLYNGGEASEIILVVAYQSGAHTVNTNGVDFAIDIPKPGIYVAGQAMNAVNVQWETIHPIDPKFVPTMDSITLNSPSGNRFTVTVDDTGAITTKKVTT